MRENAAAFVITEQSLQDKIYYVRGRKVMLDFDLAAIYGYETKNLNRQVKNNQQKFEGDDFMFQLSDEEVDELSRCKNFTLNRDMGSVERQMFNVMEKLEDVVTKSELVEMMNSFIDDEDNGWLMFNAKYCTADLAYSEVYGQAKKSIFVVDNYIGLRTLVLLKNAPTGVPITIFSDNIGNRLHSIEYKDFCIEYSTVSVDLKTTEGIYHDRFIVLDYGTDDERIFLCGASSKDAGARVTSIVEDFGIGKYKTLIEMLINNPHLKLI